MKTYLFVASIIFFLACSCKKPHEAISFGNISALLIGYKWQLISATNHDSTSKVTSTYNGTTADSIFFDWRPDSSFNVTATNIETYSGGSYATFGYTLKQIAAPTTDQNFIICAQPWKAGYSDTVRILPLVNLAHVDYIVFKIGKPYDNASEGYEIDSLKPVGPSDR